MIRAAGADDVAAVASLEAEVFARNAWSPAMVGEELLGVRRRAFVAVHGRLVGYAVTMQSEDVVDLQRIAVAPAYQRRGVARRLLAAAWSQARADGGHRMMLEVSATNQRALEFYKSAGFLEIDRRRRYYKDGTDAVVMEALLGAEVGEGKP